MWLKSKTGFVVHKLKLNDDKPIVLEIRSSHSASALGGLHIKIGEEYISVYRHRQGFGCVLLDCNFNMTNYIKQVRRQSYYHLKNISRIRNILTRKVTETLVHTFITTKLNYCNGLMCGFPRRTIFQLQRVQNSAARLITRTRKFDRISPVLRQLHWLPVAQRVIFKILVY